MANKYQNISGNDSSTFAKRPVKVNGYSNSRLHAKRDRKRQEAEARQREYDKLSLEEKLKQLGATGSNRQRARLQKQIEARGKSAPKAAEPTAVADTTEAKPVKKKTTKKKVIAEAKEKRPAKS